jgi:hypothetical protein
MTFVTFVSSPFILAAAEGHAGTFVFGPFLLVAVAGRAGQLVFLALNPRTDSSKWANNKRGEPVSSPLGRAPQRLLVKRWR